MISPLSSPPQITIKSAIFTSIEAIWSVTETVRDWKNVDPDSAMPLPILIAVLSRMKLYSSIHPGKRRQDQHCLWHEHAIPSNTE